MREIMQAEELEEIDDSNIKKQENSESLECIPDSETLEDGCREKDFNLDSVIDVSGKIYDFSAVSGKERTVKELYMYKNEFNLIPMAVGSFKSLRTLKFFSNEINLFPGEFANFVNLECLQVKVAPSEVNGLELSKLRNLKELELSRVPPRPSTFTLLSEIAGLKHLTKLSVCHFSIRYLPPDVGCLNSLEYLDLSFNKMRSLPDEITSLKLLKSLKISNNKLMGLPSRLSYLQLLENLDLSNNRLTSLDCLELETMHNLQVLDVQHNRLHGCQIPEWVCCNMEGNVGYPSNDESAEMDFCEAVCLEIDSSSRSYSTPLSHLSGSQNNRCLAARMTKGWKHRNYSRIKVRQERLNNYKKSKLDVTVETSSEKCMTCRVTSSSDNTTQENSDVLDDRLDDEDLISVTHENSIINPGKEDLSLTEESVTECSCSVIDTDGMCKVVENDSLVINYSLDSQSSNCVLKSKRHSEKDLDNPKPTKYRRPTNDASCLSLKYSERSFCGAADHLPDGFYDAGRDRPFLPLDSYENGLYINLREVILLDLERDEKLDAILLCARALLYQFKQMNTSIKRHRETAVDSLQVASLLALFVSDHFGGSDKSGSSQRARRAVSGLKYMKPFICTCAAGIKGDTSDASKHRVEIANGVGFHDICEQSLQSIKEARNSVIVPIGDLQFGICRHRALLMKYLCDRMEPQIPCELVRGYLDFSPHAWNVIVIKSHGSLVRMIVDACHPLDIRDERDPEYFCRYIPLSWVTAPVLGNDDVGPNCSFPSLTVCDEIVKLHSTSLMSCSLGAVKAAMKVRAIKASGKSAEEVRNFEYCCLGEVRMLSSLKHSCIVEYYGHQISSKWSMTADGISRVRTVQSAILMEFMEGGSLKSYLERLSSTGRNHVTPDLVLSIARDVAFALTELHSRHIIHRDIKSENILIDLVKKREDGTPVVKICDFDRAIPLYSYRHACCIAHVGVPPPDICVGTPRWMAPEVFRAMRQGNIYGLEVDIWSFGCVLLELLTLQVPYSETPASEIDKFLQIGERPRLTDELEALARSEEVPENESDQTLRFLAQLYQQCTERNPDDRPSAEKIYNSLADRARAVTCQQVKPDFVYHFTQSQCNRDVALN